MKHNQIIENLLNTIKNTRSWKLILHNNPDPDAIASAFAFSHLLAYYKKSSKIFYKGLIGRSENKEMIKRLRINLHPFENLVFRKNMNIALFDCQPGAGNQPLPKNVIPKIVIDHHPLRKESSKVQFNDIRKNIGSSSTIVAEYFKLLDIPLNNRIATALYYGLKTDTYNFTRDFGKIDLEMLQFILDSVSLKLIGKIENPPLTKEYYRKICLSLKGVTIYNKAIITDIGKVNYPDICAEVADFLIRMKNINWVIVFSYFDQKLFFSIRTKSRQKIAGKLAVYIVKKIGSGGGHENSAGGMVEVGDFDEYLKFRDILKNKFLKKLKLEKEEGVFLLDNA